MLNNKTNIKTIILNRVVVSVETMVDGNEQTVINIVSQAQRISTETS